MIALNYYIFCILCRQVDNTFQVRDLLPSAYSSEAYRRATTLYCIINYNSSA